MYVSLEIFANLLCSCLLVAALAGQAGTGTAVDGAFRHGLFTVDGEGLVNEGERGCITGAVNHGRREDNNQVRGFGLSLQGLLDETGVFSPERKPNMRIRLAEVKIVDALGGIVQVSERLKTENSGVEKGPGVDGDNRGGQDFSIAAHVLIEGRIALHGTVCKALRANATFFTLPGFTESVAQVGSAQAVDSFHFAGHVNVETDTSLLFELLHCDHVIYSFAI